MSLTQEERDAGNFDTPTPAVTTFPNLFEAKAVKRNGKDTGEPKYSINVELDPEKPADAAIIKGVKGKVLEVARARWPGRDFAKESAKTYTDGDGVVNKKIPTFVFPWSNGTEHADKAKAAGKDREFSRGKFVLTARSKFAPRLSAVINGKIVEFESVEQAKAQSKLFFNGVEALVQVNFQAYDGVGETGADGVTAYLNVVLTTGKGKKVSGGGGPSAAEVFKGYAGSISNLDPTGGGDLDDEISF